MFIWNGLCLVYILADAIVSSPPPLTWSALHEPLYISYILVSLEKYYAFPPNKFRNRFFYLKINIFHSWTSLYWLVVSTNNNQTHTGMKLAQKFQEIYNFIIIPIFAVYLTIEMVLYVTDTHYDVTGGA